MSRPLHHPEVASDRGRPRDRAPGGGGHHAVPMVNKRSPAERIDGTPCAGRLGPHHATTSEEDEHA